jgi:hypothetical protein
VTCKHCLEESLVFEWLFLVRQFEIPQRSTTFSCVVKFSRQLLVSRYRNYAAIVAGPETTHLRSGNVNHGNQMLNLTDLQVEVALSMSDSL